MVIEPGNSGVNKGTVNTSASSKQRISSGPEGGSSPSGHATTNQDSVSLSNQAHTLGRLEQAIQSAPDIDEGKVEALKQGIANGQYQVNSEALADKMLSHDGFL